MTHGTGIMIHQEVYGQYQMTYPENQGDEENIKVVGRNDPHQCNVCNKVFVSVKGLEQHGAVHIDQKRYNCEICSKSFRFQSNLMEHKSVHTGSTPYACPYCGKASRSATSSQLEGSLVTSFCRTVTNNNFSVTGTSGDHSSFVLDWRYFSNTTEEVTRRLNSHKSSPSLSLVLLSSLLTLNFLEATFVPVCQQEYEASELWRRDLVGHMAVRLFYSRLPEKRNWLIKMESELMEYRLRNEVPDKRDEAIGAAGLGIRRLTNKEKLDIVKKGPLNVNNYYCVPSSALVRVKGLGVVHETRRNAVIYFEDLMTSALSACNFEVYRLTTQEKAEMTEILSRACCINQSEIPRKNFYRVDFLDGIELVRRGLVHLKKGYAYFPFEDLMTILVSKLMKFMKKHMMLLDKTQNILACDPHQGDAYFGEIPDPNLHRDRLDTLSVESFPPCMKPIHQNLRSNHYLSHSDFSQYTLFLKGIGLSLDEAMAMMKHEFTKKIPSDKFEEEQAYFLRLIYGKNERFDQLQKPMSCTAVVVLRNPSPEAGSVGCPFKTGLFREKFGSELKEEQVQEILKLSETNKYDKACARYFEQTNDIEDGRFGQLITHPNQFYEESQKRTRKQQCLNVTLICILAADWTKLNQEQRIPFHKKAEEEKAKYLVLIEEYKKTDSHKEFQKKRAQYVKSQNAAATTSTSSKSHRKRKHQEEDSEDDGNEEEKVQMTFPKTSVFCPLLNRDDAPATSSSSSSLQYSGPIFTPEFMTYNKTRDSYRRQLAIERSTVEHELEALREHDVEVKIQKQQDRIDSLEERIDGTMEVMRQVFSGVGGAKDHLDDIDSLTEWLRTLTKVAGRKAVKEALQKHSKSTGNSKK